MKPKKNPNADLRKNIPLFFAAALCFVVFVTWRVIEFRTYESKYDYEALNVEIDDDEMIPITEQLKTPPPPPPPPAPEIIEGVEDEEEVEETVIESTETTQEEIIEEVEVLEEEDEREETNTIIIDQEAEIDIVIEVEEEPEPVVEEIFDVVEENPEFVGGMAKLYEYLGKNIQYPEMAKENGIQGKVFVQFVVWKDGTIRDVKVVKGVHKTLDNEATRVVKTMPKWTPGKQRGKAVNARFTLPIKFRIS